MQREIETSLVEKIRNAHAECIAYDDGIREVVLAKINKARECGIFLMEAKEGVGHGNFSKWVDDNFAFTIRTATTYMKFAKANRNLVSDLEEGVRTLKDAMIASGALPAPSGHKEGQQLHEPNIFALVINYVTKLNAECTKQFNLKPIEKYDPSTVQQFVDSLESGVETINGIYARAKLYVEHSSIEV